MENQPPNNNEAEGQDEQLSRVDEGGSNNLTQQSDQVADFVRERPLVAIGVATAAGFIIGRVIGR